MCHEILPKIVSPDPRKKCVLGAQIGGEENKSQVFFFLKIIVNLDSQWSQETPQIFPSGQNPSFKNNNNNLQNLQALYHGNAVNSLGKTEDAKGSGGGKKAAGMKRGGAGGGEIVQVEGGHIIRSTGRKDRHSKVFTAKGPRDRRVRLSAHTAIQFYDVQDRLGYDRPSKAVDWLIKKAKNAIDKLAELPPWNPNDDASVIPGSQEGDVAGMPLEQNSDSSARYDFPFQKHLEAAGNAAGNSPFILQEDETQSIAETMKSFFPMNSGSSLMNFQSYHHELMPRASIQTEDNLGLSLHTLQDHRRPASTSQQHALFSGANPATFEANFSRMVGWNGAAGNGGGESRVGFFLNHPHHSIPPQTAAPAVFSQGGAFSQRESLQSNYSHLIPAWEERTALSSAISNTHFAAEFQVPARIHGEDEHGGAAIKPSSPPSNSHY